MRAFARSIHDGRLRPRRARRFRNLLVTTVLVDTLQGLELRYPPAEPGIESIVVQ